MAQANPDKSRWGRMNSDQSWTPLARDIDRALARSGMTTHEAALMQFVREHSWGRATRKRRAKGERWPDALAVVWRPGEIARTIGESPVRLSEAKASLVKSLMLVETKTTIHINKNAHQWVVPYGKNAGKPRLSDAAIAYAMAAWPNPETAEMPDDEDPETTPETDGPAYGNPEETSGNPEAHKQTPLPEIRKDSYGNPEAFLRNSGRPLTEFRKPHIEDRAQGDPTELRVREGEETPPTPSPDLPTQPAGVCGGGAAEPSAPTPEPAPEPMASNPHPEAFLALCRKAKAIPALEAVRFARRLYDAWGTADGADLTNWWEIGNLPAKAWEDALIVLAGRPAEKRTVAFFVGIAANPSKRPRYERAEREAKLVGDRTAEPVEYYVRKFPDRNGRTSNPDGGAA